MADSGVWSKVRKLVGLQSGPRYAQVGLDGEPKDRSASKIKVLILTLITVVSLAVFYTFRRDVALPDYGKLRSTTSSSPPGFFHILIDAPHRNTDLCKHMLSSALLGYPGSTFVGWQEILEDESVLIEMSLYDKLTQIYHHLERKPDDDLVLVVTGYNSWFQLRPQTLLDRYYEINRRANRRLQSEFSQNVVDQYDLTQQIVFGAQKICSPGTQEDSACYAVPDSTLPVGIYDKLALNNFDDYPHGKDRQRFINSGIAIGNVKAMRALYKEASYRMTQDPTLVTDQRVFSEIFGEQETHRELLRRQLKSVRKSVSSLFSKDTTARVFKDEDLEKARSRGQALELGIGLDYESEISFATESAYRDSDWVTHSALNRQQGAGGQKRVDHKDSGVKTVQADIASTLPPFWTFSEEKAARNLDWEDVQLLTNSFTGITPAIIQHTGAEEVLRSIWWKKIWFQKNGRTLFNARISAPQGVLAVAGDRALREWWDPEDYKGGVRNTTGWWYRYDDICDKTEDEVFRDGRGRWLIPENH